MAEHLHSKYYAGGLYKKAQLTQRKTRESGACMKAHCEKI